MASFMKEVEHLELKLEEIKSATDNFNENNVIGIGGFGKVYKGVLSHYGGKSMVAIKRLDRRYGQGDLEFLKEIRMLSCYKHKNLVSLLGFCKEGNEMILIYEYASRGSLDLILNDTTLTWKQRLNICLDAARGLSFLHDPNGTQQRVLHRDIKSANILLDENLNAKVADFGLSKISPANQKYTFLVTNPVGTRGYCDPLYMDTYQLTKESDVYSFGVVLLEVLCGKLCFEYSDHRNVYVFVPYWKKCYEQKNVDEIIFPDLKQQMDQSSVKTFVDVAYQCLQKSREQRPEMSFVVEKLKAALELKELHDLKLRREYEAEEMMCKAAEEMYKAAEDEHEEMRKAAEEMRKAADEAAEEMRKAAEEMRKTADEAAEEMRKSADYKQEEMHKAAEYEYKEILKAADPPLRFLEFPVDGGQTLLSINDKGEVFCERICIEACLDPIQYDRLEDPSGFENSSFSGRRCYCKDKYDLKVRVRARFLYPQITYSVNLVFRNDDKMRYCKTLCYILNGEEKCCMVYDTYEREDGWFVVPLYQFTSDHKTADLEIYFKKFQYGIKIRVAGFEFRPVEEKVELHDQGLEEYQEIVEAASQFLFYTSPKELKELFSAGFHINNYKTWFSLNENGEHCEMLSIEHCLISREGGYSFRYTDLYSRFPYVLNTNRKGCKVHMRTQFLTPSIRYIVNLVFCKGYSTNKQKYVGLRYKLEGETETSIVYLASTTKDNRSFIAELYQFTSNGRTFDLDIVFEDHKDDLEVEGILFQPLENVENEQVLDDENLSYNNLQWRIMKEEKKCTKSLKCFKKEHKLLDIRQEGYAVDNNGKKVVMFSARAAISSYELSFQSSPESRFGEVAVTSYYGIEIKKGIKSDVVSPKTTYATYLIYKLPQYASKFNGLLKITNYKDRNIEYPYIYLVSPPDTPIMREKLHQNSHNPLNRPKLHYAPRQRKDGWMEVKVSQFQTKSSIETIHMFIWLRTPDRVDISGLMIESVELRPIVGDSV